MKVSKKEKKRPIHDHTIFQFLIIFIVLKINYILNIRLNMSFKFAKSLIKVFDNFQSGILTINKVLASSNNYRGVHSNILIEKLDKKTKESQYKDKETRIVKDNSNKEKTIQKETEKSETKIENLVEEKRTAEDIKEEFPKINDEDKPITKTEDSFLIKSDKLTFVGKQSRIPVSPMSRALNFGVLGVTMIGSGLTNMVIDKVIYLLNLG